MDRGKILFRRAGLLSFGLLLLAVPAFLAPDSTAGQEFQGGLLKANLDLPYNAGALSDDEDEDAPEILIFYGAQYEASAVAFALDESGSMRDQGRWQLQTREVTRAIRELSGRAEFSVVYYGSRVSAFRNRTVKATPGNKLAGIHFVNSRSPNGDTCIAEGTIKALKIVQRSASQHRAVIVTSDGRPDVCATGNRANAQQQQILLQQTLAANPGRAVRVHTIFVGRSNDPEAISFMKRLAGVHGGTFKLVQ